MSASFFCDTSALVKLYHQEAGTERMEEIFRQEENVLLISELAIVEFYSTLARKVRIGEITPEAQEEAHRNFEADCMQRCCSAWQFCHPKGQRATPEVRQHQRAAYA